MADGRVSYPSVFVVDGGMALPPPLPPKPGSRRIQTRRNRLIQNILLVLVCLSFIGLFVEGCFIAKLYKSEKDSTSNSQTEQGKTSAQKGRTIKEKPKVPTILDPSRPLAHLSANSKPITSGIMEWNVEGNSLIYKFNYSKGKLIVQKEGYYYVYSKLSYSEDYTSFIQMLKMDTGLYEGDYPSLITYRRHNPKPVQKGTLSDSYLGGVFHLRKGDALYVHVNNGSLVRLHNPSDNFFGMFML